MTTIPIGPDAVPDLWRGAFAWRDEDGAQKPWRLDPRHPSLPLLPELTLRAREAAGVRAVLRTNASAVRIAVRMPDDTYPGPRVLDVIADGETTRVTVPFGRSSLEVPLPGREVDVEVWLPQSGDIAIESCHLVGSDRIVVTPPADAPRWVTYGSSNTHCRRSHGPSVNWPGQIARRYGWDLFNMGFAGECLLDGAAIEAIAASRADLVSLCMGANIIQQVGYNHRTLAMQVVDTLRRVRDAHPGVPIVAISPLTARTEQRVNPVGMTRADGREQVELAVRTVMADDPLLSLVPGPSLLGPSDIGLLVDDLHAGQDGEDLIADRLGPTLAATQQP